MGHENGKKKVVREVQIESAQKQTNKQNENDFHTKIVSV